MNVCGFGQINHFDIVQHFWEIFTKKVNLISYGKLCEA